MIYLVKAVCLFIAIKVEVKSLSKRLQKPIKRQKNVTFIVRQRTLV